MKSGVGTGGGSRKFVALILIGIVALAAAFSLGVYIYSGNVSASIQESSTASIKSNDQAQAVDIADVLSAHMSAIASNLVLITDSPAVAQHNLTAVTGLLQTAQSTTGTFTLSYGWVDQTGDLLANSNATITQQFQDDHLNDTNRPYFTGARDSGTLYVSDAIESQLPTHGTVIVFAYPLFDAEHAFRGIVDASLQLEGLAALVGSDITPQYPGSVAVFDRNGTVVYGPSIILGKNALDPSVLDLVSSAQRNASIRFWTSEISSIHFGVVDSAVDGYPTFSVYVPLNVTVPSSSGGGGDPSTESIALVGLGTVVTLPADQAAQIAQLQDFSTLTILGIGSGAVGGAYFVLRWNKRLGVLVAERTRELAATNDQLDAKKRDLERMNNELTERDEAQRDFLNIAVHELRTPVQPLLTISETLKETAKDGKIELTQPEIDVIERSAKRLERLTRTVLDVTKVESGTLQLNKEPFDLNDETREAIAEVGGPAWSLQTGGPPATLLMVQPRPEVKNGPAVGSGSDQARSPRPNGTVPPSFRFSPSPDPLPVNADRTRIFEVLSNILRNAKNFSLGRDIEVTTSRDGTYAVVAVRDHGTGIDPEVMPKIFTKFASRSASGVGLGLYLSKKIVEAHGGRISAENNADGNGGATIRFSIPLNLEPTSGERDGGGSTQATRSTGEIRP